MIDNFLKFFDNSCTYEYNTVRMYGCSYSKNQLKEYSEPAGTVKTHKKSSNLIAAWNGNKEFTKSIIEEEKKFQKITQFELTAKKSFLFYVSYVYTKYAKEIVHLDDFETPEYYDDFYYNNEDFRYINNEPNDNGTWAQIEKTYNKSRYEECLRNGKANDILKNIKVDILNKYVNDIAFALNEYIPTNFTQFDCENKILFKEPFSRLYQFGLFTQSSKNKNRISIQDFKERNKNKFITIYNVINNLDFQSCSQASFKSLCYEIINNNYKFWNKNNNKYWHILNWLSAEHFSTEITKDSRLEKCRKEFRMQKDATYSACNKFESIKEQIIFLKVLNPEDLKEFFKKAGISLKNCPYIFYDKLRKDFTICLKFKEKPYDIDAIEDFDNYIKILGFKDRIKCLELYNNQKLSKKTTNKGSILTYINEDNSKTETIPNILQNNVRVYNLSSNHLEDIDKYTALNAGAFIDNYRINYILNPFGKTIPEGLETLNQSFKHICIQPNIWKNQKSKNYGKEYITKFNKDFQPEEFKACQTPDYLIYSDISPIEFHRFTKQISSIKIIDKINKELKAKKKGLIKGYFEELLTTSCCSIMALTILSKISNNLLHKQDSNYIRSSFQDTYMDDKTRFHCMLEGLRKYQNFLISKFNSYEEFQDKVNKVISNADLRMTCYEVTMRLLFDSSKKYLEKGKTYAPDICTSYHIESENIEYFNDLFKGIKIKGSIKLDKDLNESKLYEKIQEQFKAKNIKLEVKSIPQLVNILFSINVSKDRDPFFSQAKIILNRLVDFSFQLVIKINEKAKERLEILKENTSEFIKLLNTCFNYYFSPPNLI